MNTLALLRLLITYAPLIIKYAPLIKPILPVIFKLVEQYGDVLKDKLDRPNTDYADDTKDFMKEVTKKEKWDPFKKYWEND